MKNHKQVSAGIYCRLSEDGIGCGDDAEPASMPEPTPTEWITLEPTSDTTPDAGKVGALDSEVMYKDIEIIRIFEEPLEDTLGAPLESQGPYYFYDGL